MSSKHNKEPQQHKTEDQIRAEQFAQAEINRKRKRVATELFPWLMAHSKSIEDAKMLCQIIAAGIRQGFGGIMRERDVKSLNLVEMLNTKDDRYDIFKGLIEMFSDETIFNALDMIEGMPKHIDTYITEEMTKRELVTLPVKFYEDIPTA